MCGTSVPHIFHVLGRLCMLLMNCRFDNMWRGTRIIRRWLIIINWHCVLIRVIILKRNCCQLVYFMVLIFVNTPKQNCFTAQVCLHVDFFLLFVESCLSFIQLLHDSYLKYSTHGVCKWFHLLYSTHGVPCNKSALFINDWSYGICFITNQTVITLVTTDLVRLHYSFV